MSPLNIERKPYVGATVSRKITKGTKEWADYNVNCIVGCYNDCRYCYARVMARRFRRCTTDSWKNMRIREDVVKSNFKKMTGRVMFPSTHDLFEFEPFKETWLKVLAKLLASNNSVLITTKPRLPVIQEIAEKFSGHKKDIQFRFTITSKDETVLRFWEPNAPSYRERECSLRYAFMNGFKTSVSIEPFLDYDPKDLIQEIDPFVTDSIWVGRMNYIIKHGLSINEQQYYDKIRQNYLTHHLEEIFVQLKHNPKIRFKDSIKNQLKNELL